jgi:dipeptidyl aminopeptidase/acylaminoacyl peptidase
VNYLPIRNVGLALSFLLAISSAVVFAQSKPALKHSDYELWNSATGVRLAPDGKSIAYSFIPAEGDGAIVIRHLQTNTEIRIPSGGKAAEPQAGEGASTPEPGPTAPPAFSAVALPTYSPDSKKLILNLAPPRSELEKAKSEKKKPDELPKTVLAIIDVSTGKIETRIEKARSFSVHGTGAGLLVYTKEGKVEEKPKDEGKTKEQAPMPKGENKPKEEPKPKPKTDDESDVDQQPPTKGGFPGKGGFGTTFPTRAASNTDLVVRNLADGSEVVINDVGEFSITKDAKHLIYISSTKIAEKQGVFVTALGKNAPEAMKAGAGRYSRLTWDETQTKLAFFGSDPAPTPAASSTTTTTSGTASATAETTPAAPAKSKVYLWERSEKAKPATEILGADVPGLKAGMTIQERGGISFSTDGLKLSLSVGSAPVAEPKTPGATEAGTTTAPSTTAPTGRFPGKGGFGAGTAARTEEKVDLDLWHWKDELIQPMQKLRGTTDRNRTFRAVYFLDTKKFSQIGDEDKDVTVPSHGDWALATSDKRYRSQQWLSPIPRDYGLLNIRTGEAKPLAQAATSAPFRSPKGNYLLVFDGKHWSSVSIPDGKKINLTEKLKNSFVNEEFDSPTTPPPYSSPTWTTDEKFVLISDKYDLWKFAIDGSSYENVTKIGRELKTRFRPIRLADETEPEDVRGLDLTKSILLAAENLETRDTGFYRLQAPEKPKLLIMGARRYGAPTKAKNADTMLFTISTFYDYPDYYVADREFREVKRVTDINPKIRQFNWGKAEIVQYKNADGVPLQGMLIKPENFDPNKQYPMIVYIYERLSQNVHGFVAPRAGTSINPTFYASNGYLVFMPDIIYTIGSPGQSAIKCVLPAIQSVVDKGYVKEDSIGIQGHSWGGYQIAYMVTQTNRFKAASAGAPVSNMVSAYGGIRWGTGLPRQFQYEQTQSRIGATLWAATMKYIENSPIFMADRVNTPLMMLHNDQDDAVPWYQGIEYYLALRRLGKEVYLFNYNGEFHGLRKRATQKDYTIRLQQFFDHHLKGAPMPDWMAKGIPFSERDKEKEQWKKLFEPEKK